MATGYFVGGVIALVIISAADSAPFGTVSSNVKSDLVLVNRNNNGINGGGRGNVGLSGSSRRPDVPAGETLDLFYRFGFFSLSVRVVPRDDAGDWIVREPTSLIFDKSSVSERVTPSADSKFDPAFQVFFCDDVEELNEAYFRDFTAERVEQPHKLFTGSWHKTTKSKYYGLSKEAFDGQSAFVLVKLPKKRIAVSAAAKAGSALRLRPTAQRAIDSVQLGNSKSVREFLENYGSHYVQEIVVGDAVYQVIALYRDQYTAAKKAAGRMLSSGAASASDLGRLFKSHLAPWLVRETGKVQVASGDKAADSIAKNDLVTNGKFGSYPNIFVLQERPKVTARMEAATAASEAVVGMHFASLRSFVRDLQTRDYYDERVDAYMALWEANIR